MAKTRLLALVISLVALLFITGCFSQANIEMFVKSLDPVEQFLEEHPNADIRVLMWDAETVKLNQDLIEEACEQKLPAKAYWYVSVEEEGTTLKMWLDAETRQPVCVFRKGAKVTKEPEPVIVKKETKAAIPAKEEKKTIEQATTSKPSDPVVCPPLPKPTTKNKRQIEGGITYDLITYHYGDGTCFQNSGSEQIVECNAGYENTGSRCVKIPEEEPEPTEAVRVPTSTFDLSDYPKMFVKDGQFYDYLIAVGEGGSYAAVDIASNMMVKNNGATTRVTIPVDASKLPDEVLGEKDSSKMIIIGRRSCVKLNSETYCDQWGLNEGEAVVYFDDDDLYIFGYTDADTRRAARVIVTRRDELSGAGVKVRGTTASSAEIISLN